MRGLNLAFGFLTRIPMPRLDGFRAEELSRAAVWFPLVGVVIGLVLWGLAQLVDAGGSWVAALVVLLGWVAITGGLHLDGAADLADALGAAHRDPARFEAVLKDAHIGSFGVIAIVLLLLAKLVLLAAWLEQGGDSLAAFVLLPAWARLGSVLWSRTLPPLFPGTGERFAWQVSGSATAAWLIVLTITSVAFVSVGFALAALAALAGWWAFLRWRLGGMSGDCLGAGIEVVEVLLLMGLALS